MVGLVTTQHALCRAQQRGVRRRLIQLVYRHADIEAPVAGGRTALSLSCPALQRLRGEFGAATAERAKDIVLIVAGGVVITVFHGSASRRRRHCRR